MKKHLLLKGLSMALAGVLYVGSLHAQDGQFIQTNLVSDVPGVAI